MPEQFWRVTTIVVLWPRNAYVQATVGAGSVNFRTLDFGGVFFNWSYCVLVYCLICMMFIFCAKAADWGMAFVAYFAPWFSGVFLPPVAVQRLSASCCSCSSSPPQRDQASAKRSEDDFFPVTGLPFHCTAWMCTALWLDWDRVCTPGANFFNTSHTPVCFWAWQCRGIGYGNTHIRLHTEAEPKGTMALQELRLHQQIERQGMPRATQK